MTSETDTSQGGSAMHGSAPADPLLNCLVFLTRYYGKPFSASALSSGLPIENGDCLCSSLPALLSVVV